MAASATASVSSVTNTGESSSSSLWTTPADENFAFSNLSDDYVSFLSDSGPFIGIILSYWDNILGPRLRHVWRGSGSETIHEDCVKYVVSRTLNGELLRDAPENVLDTKLFVLKEKGIVCHSFIFTGRDKSGSNISAFSLILPYLDFMGYLPFVELVEERVKILIAKLRVLQSKDLKTALTIFSSYLPRFIQTLTSLQTAGIPYDIPLIDSAFGAGHEGIFDQVFLRRVITSHLQTFGSTLVLGESAEKVNLMVNTLALFLSPNERQKSRYAVDSQESDADIYDCDLYIQGLLKDSEGNIAMPVKGVITSLYPTTLVDVDSSEVKQTYPYHEHAVIRQEFLDLELTLIWESQEDAPVYPSLGLFHVTEDIGLIVQTFMNDINVLPLVCDVRKGFIAGFLRLLVRKALALIKYVEAKSKRGKVPLDYAVRRQLRHDLQLTTEADFSIVLACAEKHKPGLYTFLMGDPRHAVARVQSILESL